MDPPNNYDTLVAIVDDRRTSWLAPGENRGNLIPLFEITGPQPLCHKIDN